MLNNGFRDHSETFLDGHVICSDGLEVLFIFSIFERYPKSTPSDIQECKLVKGGKPIILEEKDRRREYNLLTLTGRR